ncbi:transcriptional regulator, MerR family [Xylanimonas cellulosilytica DSM 15894]|uniref:Transcriptional regulator, MerR family n=1 Tax=Xylanimonas cellulosilytica (strain DSM 15894 / JCM 12276 / CECT 5975 / KCTC 9989 / LMG 20990 / NBRC 107835 / XIL07) TaxID=446471 RepID=D1BYC0_XYLCX|nr:MerR family transcriptional regulator [Xylanimonas cellulosilytica]ACZ31792.1 transcriptional regulator, MerR family [Xylanimonas cellulosilytica DSM 15894]
MMRIGEAARQFGISTRTLRYWEEAGILVSTRDRNEYRYYDEENVALIAQIAALRSLQVPISVVEAILRSRDVAEAARLLESHLVRLRSDAARGTRLAVVVGDLIGHLSSARTLAEGLRSLGASPPAAADDVVVDGTGPTEGSTMSALTHVRLVQLPALTVAAYRAVSAQPEDDCSRVMNPFVVGNRLDEQPGFRFFGFNNPDPSPNEPTYGYEMWVTIPDGFEVPEPLRGRRFDGGLYASTSTQLPEIGERWQALVRWVRASEDYSADSCRQWLEETTMPFAAFASDDVDDGDKQLDLLLPVVPR